MAAAEPEGVAEVSADLVLLGSGEPLRIPVTQSEGPMTEDMMERKLEAMTEMGTSDEAIAARTQMQSTSLRSDMSAFKAANPGACLQYAASNSCVLVPAVSFLTGAIVSRKPVVFILRLLPRRLCTLALAA